MSKPTVGFEPTTPGLQNQSRGRSTSDHTSTYESVKQELTPQLTPKFPRQGQMDTRGLPSELAEIVDAWPKLPGPLKAAIRALIRSYPAED